MCGSCFFFLFCVLNCQIQGEINASAQQAWWVTMQSWPPCNFGPLVRSCKVANHNQKSYAGEKSKRTLEVMTHVKMIKVSWFFSMNVSIKLPVVSVYLGCSFVPENAIQAFGNGSDVKTGASQPGVSSPATDNHSPHLATTAPGIAMETEQNILRAQIPTQVRREGRLKIWRTAFSKHTR